MDCDSIALYWACYRFLILLPSPFFTSGFGTGTGKHGGEDDHVDNDGPEVQMGWMGRMRSRPLFAMDAQLSQQPPTGHSLDH